MKTLALVVAVALAASPAPDRPDSPFERALETARGALERGDLDRAHASAVRAIEWDPRAPEAWEVRAACAREAGRLDEQLLSLHRRYRLVRTAGADRRKLAGLRAELEALDPVASTMFELEREFLGRLEGLAEKYEDGERPHAAIATWKRLQALDPDHAGAQESIERIASTPDPSLAAHAKPRDLLEGITRAEIEAHDAEHATWRDRAKLERENYVTHTDAGYETLVRAAEAMEQMNAFYRRFFRYGTEEDGGSVPRIQLRIFRDREEYLDEGTGPPAEWSAGQFTGSAVETYVGEGGFEEMTTTLFHEAAHQFVSLSTNAVGWLNEGLASYFEGSRILANGSVVTNLPANHRLFALADRMERGWMAHHLDGTDPEDPGKVPDEAPTFRIVLESRYTWGPPWYAPTWGVVYFLHNYQDPVDGRFVYRDAFRAFIDVSGGRMGDSAVQNFEETVLANPRPPYPGVERGGVAPVALPETADELNELWRDWILALRDVQRGSAEVDRPYALWGRYAAENGDHDVALEHFERGLVEAPEDVELLTSFAALLEDHFENPDRAARLVERALRELERAEDPDDATIRDLERWLGELDPRRDTLTELSDELADAAREVVDRYAEAELPMMVLDVSYRFGTELELPSMFASYASALEAAGEPVHTWERVYDEESLDGWIEPEEGGAFRAAGAVVEASFGGFDASDFSFEVLPLDRVTSGDFSLEAEVRATRGDVQFAGLVFGRKESENFHGVVYFPGRGGGGGVADAGFVDLMSSFGGDASKTWAHVPVEGQGAGERSSAGEWHTLRLDVAGRVADVWFDGRLLASHPFPSTEVVRGSFGLITSAGSASFRNIRLLDRPAGDPAARIEREHARGGRRDSASGPVDGSWLGMRPPFPEVRRWAQSEREGWEERAGAPQLLVFFSIAQNEIVPIDGWLRRLAEERRNIGLEIVAVASFQDESRIDAFLAGHPLPGAVAVDRITDSRIGDTFERYALDRFNLPRLILVDAHGRVAWEGDPGIRSGEAEDPGARSYLDDPLDELVVRDRLVELARWRARWVEAARPALLRGDLEAALPVLLEARDGELPPTGLVAEAVAMLERLERALDDVEATAARIADAGAQPAGEVLLEWAKLLDREPVRRVRRDVADAMEGEVEDAWNEALEGARKLERARERDPAEVEALAASLESLPGVLPRGLASDLREALSRGDAESVGALLSEAPRRPAAWLARTLTAPGAAD